MVSCGTSFSNFKAVAPTIELKVLLSIFWGNKLITNPANTKKIVTELRKAKTLIKNLAKITIYYRNIFPK